MSIAQEIQHLEDLRRTGALSEDEFHQAKQQVLESNGQSTVQYAAGSSGSFTHGMIYGFQEQTWCMLLHLSQLLIFAGGIGLVVPIVMWVTTKEQSELANQHGVRMMNWLLSSLIYGVVSGILCVFIIGIPMLFALLLLNIVFPVMAGMKASDGQLWSYPMTIRFFPEENLYVSE